MKNIWEKISAIAQVLIVIGALIAIYVNFSERLTRIETKVTFIETEIRTKNIIN